ncbi:Clp protease ClpP [Streptococcus mutans]|nr:Clp protease ClpP [Streptococcus mutans]
MKMKMNKEIPNMSKFMNMKGSFKVENLAETEAKLSIYGVIGSWWDDNEATDFQRKLSRITADVIHVHIHSPGGDAFDGIAICNMLKAHPAKIIVHVDGYACSAASVIAMSGDEVIMPSNTMMMIHQASTFGWGNADELSKLAEDLRKIDTSLRATYLNRFVGTEEELKVLLNVETWLTAPEAVAMGFADKVTDDVEIPVTEESEDNDGYSEGNEPEELTVENIMSKYKNNKGGPIDNEDEGSVKDQDEPIENKVVQPRRFAALLNL